MHRRINAQKSGNWSDVETWGGILPTQDDDVFCNGFNITIDTDVYAKSISNMQTYYDITGGNIIALNGVTINSDIECFSTPILILEEGNININGNVKGSSYIGEVPCIINNGLGTVNVSGIVTGGSAGYSCGIINNNIGTIQVTGNVGLGGGYSYAIYNTNNGKIIINGVESTQNGGYGDNPIS
jgi:hypothetical protein